MHKKIWYASLKKNFVLEDDSTSWAVKFVLYVPKLYKTNTHWGVMCEQNDIFIISFCTVTQIYIKILEISFKCFLTICTQKALKDIFTLFTFLKTYNFDFF